ncbi:MAG: WG repeat-containing protein [Bacteroidota bacterium]
MRPILPPATLLFLVFISCWNVASAQKQPLVYPFVYGTQWGLVDQNRTTVLGPSLDSIGLFFIVNPDATYPKQALAIKSDRCGVLNTAGEWIMKPKADSIGRNQYYAKGLAWVRRKGKYGLMDFNGEKARWRIKPRFTKVGEFRGRKLAVAVVAINDRWGVVNAQGEFVAKCDYDEVQLIHDFSDYPDIKLAKGEEVSYISARGEARDADKLAWEEEIVFEDQVIEDDSYQQERKEHRIVKDILAGGRLRISLEVASAGQPFQVVEQRTVGTAYSIYNVEVNEDVNPMQIKCLLVQRDGKMGFWGRDGLVAPGTVYDRIITTRAGRYGELAALYMDKKKAMPS